MHELVGLGGGQKLGFVNENAGNVCVFLLDFGKKIVSFFEGEVRFPFGADTSEEFVAVFGVGLGFNHANFHSTLLVVESNL